MYEQDEYEAAETIVTPVLLDHFDKYLGNVVMVNLSTGSRPITGMLRQIDEYWITLQKHDGGEVDIKKKAVHAIGQVKPREGYAERSEAVSDQRERNESIYDEFGRYVR